MQRVLAETGTASVRFLQAEEDGIRCWFYLRLLPEKAEAYHAALSHGTMEIRDYGRILESAPGQQPPPDIVQFMQAEYGVEIPS